MDKRLPVHHRTDSFAPSASPPILIALAKQGSYVIVNFLSPTAPLEWPDGRRPLDEDLLSLHFRGTSYATAITMPAVHQPVNHTANCD
jgi:hypothetical protein